MSSIWSVHYDRWLIDDGEPEREIGERFRSVVGFGSVECLSKTSSQVMSAVGVHDFWYDATGKVVHTSSKAAVVDFGFNAVGAIDSLPMPCQAGDHVAGQIKLFFQHWCYPLPDHIFELIDHEWSIDGILADLTPHIKDQTGSYLKRDEHNVIYQPVTSTREKRTKSYVLQCRLLQA